MNFDMNTCWSRALELVRANFQLLAVIAAIFFLLPTLAIYLLLPDMQSFADPAADPDIVAERMQEILGPLLAIILASTLVQFAGYGAMVALMGEQRPTVGQALAMGFRIVPSLVAVLILFMLAYFVGALVIMVPITLLAGVSGVPALGLVAVIPVLLFVVWLMARLSMSMPAMVLGGNLNPLRAMADSFALTKPRQWPIMLFWFMIFTIMAIIGLMISGAFSVFAALVGGGIAGMVVMGIVNGAWSMISGMITSALAVAMYAQLSGPGAAAIAETFD
jgi:hypothetical protein